LGPSVLEAFCQIDAEASLSEIGWCLRDKSQAELAQLIGDLRTEYLSLQEGDPRAMKGLRAEFVARYLSGDVSQCLVLFDALHSLLPEDHFFQSRSDGPLQRAQGSLDELFSPVYSEAERLWLQGSIFFELYREFWNPGNDGFDHVEYPFSYFRRLLSEHPECEWADNAEFAMKSFYEMQSHEGGWQGENMRHIREYEAMLERYADTETAPRILLRIGWLLHGCAFDGTCRLTGTPDSMEIGRQFERRAIAYADRINEQYPSSEVKHEAADLRRHVLHGLLKASWTLRAELINPQYTVEEPILVRATLVRTADGPGWVRIRLDRSLPNVEVVFSTAGGANSAGPGYDEIEPQQASVEFELLMVDESYEENVVLNRAVRRPLGLNDDFGNWEFSPLVKYRFHSPGTYWVRVRLQVSDERGLCPTTLRSEPVSFTLTSASSAIP